MRERALQAYPESEGSLKRTPPAGAVVLTAWHVRALWAIELSTDRIALIGVLGIIADAGQSRHRAAPRGKEIPAFLLEFSALAVIHTKKGTRTPVRPGSFSFVCLQDTSPLCGEEEWSDKQMHRAHIARFPTMWLRETFWILDGWHGSGPLEPGDMCSVEQEIPHRSRVRSSSFIYATEERGKKFKGQTKSA